MTKSLCGLEDCDCGYTIEKLEVRLDCGKDTDCADVIETEEQCLKHYVPYMEARVEEAERELAEHGCHKVEREAFRARDRYKALAERREEALDAWGRYSRSSKPSKELLVEALRLTDAAEAHP